MLSDVNCMKVCMASIHSKTRKDTLTAWARPQDLSVKQSSGSRHSTSQHQVAKCTPQHSHARLLWWLNVENESIQWIPRMQSRGCALADVDVQCLLSREMPKGWDNNSKAESKTRGFAMLLTGRNILLTVRRLRCDNDMADANLRPY